MLTEILEVDFDLWTNDQKNEFCDKISDYFSNSAISIKQMRNIARWYLSTPISLGQVANEILGIFDSNSVKGQYWLQNVSSLHKFEGIPERWMFTLRLEESKK